MKIAIGLPNSLPRTPGADLIAWARDAEEHGFSSLGTIGRVVYDSHEELVALAACAAVTSRIGLATTLLVSPVREPVLLAKQAATLDAISGGGSRSASAWVGATTTSVRRAPRPSGPSVER